MSSIISLLFLPKTFKVCSELHFLCLSSGASSCGGKFPAQKHVNPECTLSGSRDPELSRPSPDLRKECEKFCFGIHEVLSRIWEQFLLCSFGVFLGVKYTPPPFFLPMCSSQRNNNNTYVPTTDLEIEHSILGSQKPWTPITEDVLSPSVQDNCLSEYSSAAPLILLSLKSASSNYILFIFTCL